MRGKLEKELATLNNVSYHICFRLVLRFSPGLGDLPLVQFLFITCLRYFSIFVYFCNYFAMSGKIAFFRSAGHSTRLYRPIFLTPSYPYYADLYSLSWRLAIDIGLLNPDSNPLLTNVFQTMYKLKEKKDYLEKQLNEYNNYVKACLEQSVVK